MDNCHLNKHHLCVNWRRWDMSFRFFFVLINKAGFTTKSWFCQLRIIVGCCERSDIATRRQLLAGVRQRNYGIKCHSPHTQMHTGTQKNPSVPQQGGKCEGDDWLRHVTELSIRCVILMCPQIWKHTSGHVRAHKNRDGSYPVKSNPWSAHTPADAD